MVIRTPSELGATVRERRRKLGLEQQQLAEMAGVSRKWIVEVEQGKAGASIGLILRTLRALGLSLGVTEEAARAVKKSANEVDLDAIIERARKR